MSVVECLRVALRGLAANKLRTSLTMLGIIIGVGVVILVVAIGQGAAQRVADAVNSLGTNMLMIWPGERKVRVTAATRSTATTSTTNSSGTASTNVTGNQINRLTLEDARLIAQNFSKTVAAVAPQVRGDVQITFNGTDSTTNLTGTTPEFQLVNNYTVDSGRFFNTTESDGEQKVCDVGVTVADKLTGSPTTDLTGQTIYINHQDYKVLGMLTPKGSGSWGQDQDDVVIVPITTAMRRILNTQYINSLSVRCVSQKMMPLAQEEITGFLRNRHRLQPPFPDNDDFRIFSQTELLQRQTSITDTMTSMLSAVAVISLIVGGIGIMNIMLVSVTERTREIGIRKAIGATPRDILLQFLIESSIISLIGGVIGISGGIGFSKALASLGWGIIVSPTSIVAAIVVSASVGLFFGIYPATKASALHPIEALRYE